MNELLHCHHRHDVVLPSYDSSEDMVDQLCSVVGYKTRSKCLPCKTLKKAHSRTFQIKVIN